MALTPARLGGEAPRGDQGRRPRRSPGLTCTWAPLPRTRLAGPRCRSKRVSGLPVCEVTWTFLAKLWAFGPNMSPTGNRGPAGQPVVPLPQSVPGHRRQVDHHGFWSDLPRGPPATRAPPSHAGPPRGRGGYD